MRDIDLTPHLPVTVAFLNHETGDVETEVFGPRDLAARSERGSVRSLEALRSMIEWNADSFISARAADGSLLAHRDLPGLPPTGDVAAVMERLLEAAFDRAGPGLAGEAQRIIEGLRRPSVDPDGE